MKLKRTWIPSLPLIVLHDHCIVNFHVLFACVIFSDVKTDNEINVVKLYY